MASETESKLAQLFEPLKTQIKKDYLENHAEAYQKLFCFFDDVNDYLQGNKFSEISYIKENIQKNNYSNQHALLKEKISRLKFFESYQLENLQIAFQSVYEKYHTAKYFPAPADNSETKSDLLEKLESDLSAIFLYGIVEQAREELDKFFSLNQEIFNRKFGSSETRNNVFVLDANSTSSVGMEEATWVMNQSITMIEYAKSGNLYLFINKALRNIENIQIVLSNNKTLSKEQKDQAAELINKHKKWINEAGLLVKLGDSSSFSLIDLKKEEQCSNENSDNNKENDKSKDRVKFNTHQNKFIKKVAGIVNSNTKLYEKIFEEKNDYCRAVIDNPSSVLLRCKELLKTVATTEASAQDKRTIVTLRDSIIDFYINSENFSPDNFFRKQVLNFTYDEIKEQTDRLFKKEITADLTEILSKYSEDKIQIPPEPKEVYSYILNTCNLIALNKSKSKSKSFSKEYIKQANKLKQKIIAYFSSDYPCDNCLLNPDFYLPARDQTFNTESHHRF